VTVTLPDWRTPKNPAQHFSNFFTQKIDSIRYYLHNWLPCYPVTWITYICVRAQWVINMKSPDKSCELHPMPIWLLNECMDAPLLLLINIIDTSSVFVWGLFWSSQHWILILWSIIYRCLTFHSCKPGSPPCNKPCTLKLPYTILVVSLNRATGAPTWSSW